MPKKNAAIQKGHQKMQFARETRISKEKQAIQKSAPEKWRISIRVEC